MLIKKIDDLPVESWKNGGGVTRTVAIDERHDPPFWRLSVANIHRSGQFSCFEGIDRISVLMEGPGLRLKCGSNIHVYHSLGESYAYGGEEVTEALLGDAACRFLNVMVRRGTCQVKVERDVLAVNLGQFLAVLLVPLRGAIRLTQQNVVIATGEYLLLKQKLQVLSIAPQQPSASWMVVAISPNTQ